jgi:hypothetical protein
MISSTADRVPLHTAKHVNDEIRRHTEANVAHYAAAGPAAIDRRLHELDREWDIERLLELNFAIIVALGIGLGAALSWWILLLPGIASLFMIQHALQGWCPPVPVFRRLGFRTQREIDEERYALKALRGDFESLPTSTVGDGQANAQRALEAAHT